MDINSSDNIKGVFFYHDVAKTHIEIELKRQSKSHNFGHIRESGRVIIFYVEKAKTTHSSSLKTMSIPQTLFLGPTTSTLIL